MEKENIYLHRIFNKHEKQEREQYPFSIPVIANFKELVFNKSVTYIVGPNGSGKSTLLEAIAVLLGMNPEGGTRNFNFRTVDSHSSLWEELGKGMASLSFEDTFFFRAESYYNVISEIATNNEFVSFFTKFVQDTNNATLTRNFAAGETKNIIDAVYGLTTKQWDALLTLAKGSSFEETLNRIHIYVGKATNFLGLSISDSPMEIVKNAWADRPALWGLLIAAAVAFPLLAWLTQWLTYKLMPQPATTGKEDGGNGMSSAMQSMNTVMPIMSAFFCLTLPVGVGIYWIMSAVIRAIQQFVINKRLDQESQEDIIKAAQEKMNKKRARQGLPPQKITNQAHTSTKSFQEL